MTIRLHPSIQDSLYSGTPTQITATRTPSTESSTRNQRQSQAEDRFQIAIIRIISICQNRATQDKARIQEDHIWWSTENEKTVPQTHKRIDRKSIII